MSLRHLLPLGLLVTLLPLAQAGTKVALLDQAMTPERITTACICMTIGLMFAFFGYRLFRLVISLTGFIVFALVTLSLCVNVHPPEKDSTRFLYMGIALGAGVIGAIMFTCFYHIGVYFIGGFGGLTLAMWIQGLGHNGAMIESEVGKAVFFILFALLGMLLIAKFEKPIVIWSTALAGSYLAILGLDFFAQTGFSEAAQVMFLTEKIAKSPKYDSATMAMQCAVILLTLVSGLFQSRAMGNATYYRSGAHGQV